MKLQQQPFEILRLLVIHRGNFVSRQEIQKVLWPDGYFVDFEQQHQYRHHELRHALRENASSPAYIETVPRKGYRLIAPIAEEETAGQFQAIAVLPLRDLSRDTDTHYFADGLTDMLVTEMGATVQSAGHLSSRHSALQGFGARPAPDRRGTEGAGDCRRLHPSAPETGSEFP